MQIAFVLDIIIAVLLVLTITYAVRLNQRLGQLRKDKKELQKLAKTFAEATAKAETGIRQLKVSSESLHKELEEAEKLREDLAYLVDRGGRTADQMVASVRSGSHKPENRTDDDRLMDDEETGNLIQKAIRSVAPGRRVSPKPVSRDETEGGVLGATEALAARGGGKPSRPAPVAPRAQGADALGGGLDGLTSRDRLLDLPGRESGAKTIGDSDAARELLKALSGVK